jgi:hypothetical protein
MGAAVVRRPERVGDGPGRGSGWAAACMRPTGLGDVPQNIRRDWDLVQVHADLPGSPAQLLRPAAAGRHWGPLFGTAEGFCANGLDSYLAVLLTAALQVRAGPRPDAGRRQGGLWDAHADLHGSVWAPSDEPPVGSDATTCS